MKDLLPLDTVSSYAQHRLQRARELARSAWAMVAMLTIGLVVVALLSLLLSYRLQTALAEQRVQNITQNAARLLEITLYSTQNQLSMVAEHIAETKGYTNINNYLSEQVYRLKGVRKILFINPLGRVLASSKPEDALIGRDVSQRPFYKAMVALNAQARFSTPEAGLGDNQPRWLYSYAVKNEADLRLGILVAIFDNEALTTHLISGRDTAFMVQFDDDIIAQSLPPDAGDFINQRTDYIVSEQSVTPWPITITAGLSKQHVLHNITEQLWLWGGLLSGLLVLIWVLARLHVQHVLRLYLQAAVIERQNIDLRSAADNLRREGHERVQAESQRDGFFTLSADLLAIISHEGRFERVNPAFSSVLGEDEARLRGVDLVSFIHTDEAKGFRHALEQLEDGGGAIALEARVQTRLGFCWFL